jgi:hypothetical protein
MMACATSRLRGSSLTPGGSSILQHGPLHTQLQQWSPRKRCPLQLVWIVGLSPRH